jgi:1,4-dihydroxy-2-naphthoate octaprenyltransferase
MKFKWYDWLLVVALLLNVLSLAVGNHRWQSWVTTGFILLTVMLRVAAYRQARQRQLRSEL